MVGIVKDGQRIIVNDAEYRKTYRKAGWKIDKPFAGSETPTENVPTDEPETKGADEEHGKKRHKKV